MIGVEFEVLRGYLRFDFSEATSTDTSKELLKAEVQVKDNTPDTLAYPLCIRNERGQTTKG